MAQETDRASHPEDDGDLERAVIENLKALDRDGDCFDLTGDANERASGRDGDDLFFAADGNDIFCGAGRDTVRADEEDRVASA